MRCLPGPRPRRVVGVAEVIRVRRLAHPALLARGLARSPTRFLYTVTLALPIAGIGHEKPFAVRALTLTGRMHGAGQPRRPATPRQTHRPTLHPVHEGRKSTRPKKMFLMESGRKSSERTVSFKPLEEDGFQIGAGTAVCPPSERPTQPMCFGSTKSNVSRKSTLRIMSQVFLPTMDHSGCRL